MQTERGLHITLDFEGVTIFIDPLNPGARADVWEKVKQNYYSKGIQLLWLDIAEPEFGAYDFDHYRYYLGPVLSVGNLYPREYSRLFREGMRQEGQENVVNLVRCAWA